MGKATEKKTPIMLLANKIDDLKERAVSRHGARNLAMMLNAFFFEVSAKEKMNVETLFKLLDDRLDRKSTSWPDLVTPTFVPREPFDNNGILYYLATNGLTELWMNPDERGLVKCAVSSLSNHLADCAEPRALVGRE